MKINYGRQKIDKLDIKAVSRSLKNDLLTTGKIVENFENSLKKYLNTKNVITCNSGTSAIFLSLLSLNIRKNANIIIPAINFVAAANLCHHLGYNVFFCDIEISTGQISSKKIFECIKKNKLKKIDLIFTMHLGGNPENVVEIYKLKKKLNCFIIEDACHSFGSSYIYKNKKFKVGNAKHSDFTTFSFHPLKTITTGEGGAITTQNNYLAKKIKNLRSHGMINKKGINYDIISAGFNFRLSDINCALGLSQLSKIKKILNYRRNLFRYYLKNLNGYKNVVEFLNKNFKNSSCHLVIIKINFKKLKISKKQFYNLLKNKGINCQFHYIPQYNFKLFEKKEKLKNSEIYFYNYISLPIHLKIGYKQIRFVIKQIKNIIDKKII
tara:strand:+ start:2012 stop:3154 length:1143 start_codon:yes stop_codon:yes gene_type:complete